MRVAIRADASAQIGTGHVMRCLTLAAALRDTGAEVHFICRASPGNLIDRIKGAGFSCAALTETDLPPGRNGWRDDAIATRTVLEDLGGVDLLVVDHYALDAHWEAVQLSLTRRIMVIDDLADRRHDADILLDQNLGRQPADYAPLVPPSCRLLVGTGFALLRPEFSARRAAALARRAGPRARAQVLISFGGGDCRAVTGQAVAGLATLGSSKLGDITVALGESADCGADIERLAAASALTVRVAGNASDMSALMAEADLALGAAGTTSWERCTLGLPTLLVVRADNQRPIAASLERAGAALCLGEEAETTAEDFARAVDALLSQPQRMQDMSTAAALLCDGSGTGRVVDVLLARHVPGSRDRRTLHIREAADKDSDDILAWRNDPQTRTASFHDEEISAADHAEWFAACLADPNRLLMIGEDEGKKIGVVRFDHHADASCEVNINLNPHYRGQGYGRPLLIGAISRFGAMRPGELVTARVKNDNAQSHRLFQKAGFTQHKFEDGYIVYLWTPSTEQARP